MYFNPQTPLLNCSTPCYSLDTKHQLWNKHKFSKRKSSDERLLLIEQLPLLRSSSPPGPPAANAIFETVSFGFLCLIGLTRVKMDGDESPQTSQSEPISRRLRFKFKLPICCSPADRIWECGPWEKVTDKTWHSHRTHNERLHRAATRNSKLLFCKLKWQTVPVRAVRKKEAIKRRQKLMLLVVFVSVVTV